MPYLFLLLLFLTPLAVASAQEEQAAPAAKQIIVQEQAAPPVEDSLSPEALRELQQALQKEREQSQQHPSAEEEAASGDIVADADNSEQSSAKQTAILRGLNKITGHTLMLEAPVKKPITFGNLEIVVHSCWQSAPSQHKEAKALLEILEQKPNEPKKRIFYGWMFSTSPSLSALEDPVNDVVVKGCK